MGSLPAHLPAHVDQLIDELDELNPAPIVTGTIAKTDIQELVFAAGRRSVVEELLRLKESAKGI